MERPPADPDASSDEIMDRLGGRTLGEAGTTGGTTIGAQIQAEAENATMGGDRVAANRSSDPGIGGRTSRGGLGGNLAGEVAGRDEVGRDDLAEQVEESHDIPVNKILPEGMREALGPDEEYRARRPTGRDVPLDNQAEQ